MDGNGLDDEMLGRAVDAWLATLRAQGPVAPTSDQTRGQIPLLFPSYLGAGSRRRQPTLPLFVRLLIPACYHRV